MPSTKSFLSWKALALIGLQIVAASPLGPVRHRRAAAKPKTTKPRATWKPSVGDTWQIVLQDPIKVNKKTLSPNVKVWTLDMYDNDASTFKALQDAGKKVICYFSAGSWEDWRDDADQFNDSDLGNDMDGWDDERWLNTRSTNVRNIMKKRIAYAASKGCNAIDPDNLDGYGNDTGMNLSKADSINYIKFLAKTAAAYNMSIGCKNSPEIVAQVIGSVDFVTVEQCVEYDECDAYAPYIKAGKPVFHIEYPDSPNSMSTASTNNICTSATKGSSTYGFTTVIKKLALDGWVKYCGGSQVYTTSVQSK
ncbi:glycoside hydrolase superfamily [Ilyonectria sp. MPI-CAGE-AT-0026]|nr:glycoside hydrolase superfamily [Ilyonectria sp. MPI-CAGE-AT-0026]